MTNIRLVYNPFTKETSIYNENQELVAAENKIYTFLNTNCFYDCLLPFNKRYVIWEGLLPELLNEANDEELHIVFEGRKEDFLRVKEAFEQLKPAVENAGYENKWSLKHVRNFEASDLAGQLLDIARSLREMCESRRELGEIDSLITGIRENNVYQGCKSIGITLTEHIAKWEQSGSDYKQEKISYLKMLENRLDEVQNHAENYKETIRS